MALEQQQNLWLSLKSWRFKPAQQQSFLEDLLSLLEDGVSLKNSIEMMGKINRGISAEVVSSVLLAIASGQPFTDGMRGWFSAPIVEMIRAGEEGGTLIQALQTAIESIEQKRSAIATLLSTLSYPIIVAVACIIVTVFLNHSIFQDFQKLLPTKFWPSHALYLMNFANFMQNWWWILLLTVALLLAFLLYALRHYTGTYRILLDNTPLFSLYRILVASHFMENLGMLVANGLIAKQAFVVMRRNASPYLRHHIMSMELRLGSGADSIGEVLDTGMIGKEDILRLKLVMKAKSFENTLVRLGRAAAKRAHQKILISGRIISGSLLFLVAFLALVMIFSIYDVGSALGTHL